MPTREDARVVLGLELAQRLGESIGAPKRNSTPSRASARASCGQRLAQLAVRRDREADEPADLVALVVDRDVVAEQRELAGAREPGRAGADARRRACRCAARARAQRTPRASAHVGRVALERADRDRLRGPRARARRRPRRASRPGRRARRCRRAGSRRRSFAPRLRDRRRAIAPTKPGTSTSGRAGRGARRGGVRAAALEAAHRLRAAPRPPRVGARARRRRLRRATRSSVGSPAR